MKRKLQEQRYCVSFNRTTKSKPSICTEEGTKMCVGKNKCGHWYCLTCYDNPCHQRGECFNISNIAAVSTAPVPTAPVPTVLVLSAAPVSKMKKKKKETITTIDLGGSSSSSSNNNKPVTRQTSRDESDEDSDYVFKERKDVDESSIDGNN
jgi:hypothetical protein